MTAQTMAEIRPGSEQAKRRNLRTALLLVSLALAFFAGIVIRYVMFR